MQVRIDYLLFTTNLSFNFLIGQTTVSKFLGGTYDAIYEALAPIYLRPPNTKAEWKEISDQYMDMWNMPHIIRALLANILLWIALTIQEIKIITTKVFIALCY